MSQPLGATVGNALEVKEAIDLLRGQGPPDLEELSLILSAHILVLAGKYASFEQALEQVRRILLSGAGFEKFCELVTAQEGSLEYGQPGYGLPQAAYRTEVRAEEEGYIVDLDALGVGHNAMLLGAGRQMIGDKIDLAVGIQLLKKMGDYVRTGEVLAIIHASRKEDLSPGISRLRDCYHLDAKKPALRPLIIGTVR